MNNLQLIKTESFNSIPCNFYQNSNKEIFMTREQIGQALEYAEPMKQIAKIHERHKERLNKFSFVKTTNGRNTYFYSMKGVYEIYRWSRQPRADAFIDFCWNVIEEIRKGSFRVEPIQLQCIRETNRTLKFIQSKALRDNIAKQMLSKLYGVEIRPEEFAEISIDDKVRDFVSSNCVMEDRSMILVGKLYEAYLHWCKYNRLKSISKIQFGKNVAALGIGKLHNNVGRFWIGIRLKEASLNG